MTKIESQKKFINKPAKEVFEFLCDFTNFSLLIPDKVENWKATNDSSSFNIKGFGDFGMKIIERNPYTSIIINNDEAISMPIKFIFKWEFNSKDESSVETSASFNLDINPMLSMMVKKPLNDFLNVILEKLKERMESN